MPRFPHKDDLVAFLELATRDYDIRMVALFGSACRGDWMEGSDVDVFLVASDFPTNMLERWDALNEYMIPVDFKAYTITEFEAMVRDWHLFVLEVLDANCILHDPDGLAAKAMKEFTRLRNEGAIVRHGDKCWVYPVTP